jgi:hypothetical protein
LSFVAVNELRDIEYFSCDSTLLSAPTDSVCQIPTYQNGLACPVQCGKEVLDQFGMAYSEVDMGLDYGVLCIYTLAFTFFSYLVLRSINHVKR